MKPTLYEFPRIATVLADTPIGTELTVKGWARSRRDSKAGLSFIELNDGSSFGSLQVIAKQELAEYESVVKSVNTGAAVVVRGTLIESPGEGQRVELEAAEVTLVGATEPDYPLQKKRHSMEFLREISHLRGRTNAIGATLRVRAELAQSIHRYFSGNGFHYVHTPIVTTSDCEGAGEMFRVTTLDPADPPRDDKNAVDYGQDFFGKSAFLTVSGQLQGEALAMALGRIYTFGPTFRAENSNTARHASEFWMVEPEMAFCDLNLNAEVAEDFLRTVIGDALNKCEEDLVFFDKRVEPGLLDTLKNVVENQFERMTYTEAIDRLNASGEKFEYAPQWGKALQTEHERYLTEKVLGKPLIVTDYPGDGTAFYMRLNDDEKTVRAMDVLVPRVGEMIGGSEREERYDVLLKRLKHHGLKEEDYWWYLDLRKQGGTPHSGFGLGFERLVMFTTGMKNIRDVLPFPRTPRNADF